MRDMRTMIDIRTLRCTTNSMLNVLKSNNIHFRPKKVPISQFVSMGDMGWTDILINELLCMLRYWNRVIIMDNARLERRIFMWDYNKGGDNWSNKIDIIILNSIN